VVSSRVHRWDHHVAEVLQRNLLTELPRIPGVDLHGRYLPAQAGAAVGGDWYDAFRQPDGSVMLAVGDVCGHDIEAAAAMGQLRSLMRGDAYGRDDEPGQVLTDVHRAMEGMSMAVAATLLLARLRRTPAGYTVAFANAGHPPPVLLRPDGGAEVWWEEAEPLLGLLPVGQRTTRRRTAAPGSTLVLYTDGLIEDTQWPIDEGLRRMARLVQANADLPAEQLCDVLVEAAPRRTDDIAVLLARLTG
jgi:serine phosphatase RsbU (regulator of sigma subunit)